MIYKLEPILKHRLWGGSSLPTIYGINTNDTIGEAWIVSCINDDNCKIVGSNLSLKQLFEKDPNIVAKGYTGSFPLLIKLIDAKQDLSIQVHPSIKTEFWHILNTKPSKLYMGFNKDVNKDEVEKALKESKITSLLNHVDVSAGNSYLIKPGTVHAICADTFLIEIQQSADVTYRLYDYNRKDSNGQLRPLHIKESLDCLDYKKLEVDNSKAANDHLVSCKYFNVYKYAIKPKLELVADDKSFNTVTVLSGDCVIKNNNQEVQLKEYETAFIPASSGSYTIEGKCIVIVTTL